MKCSSCNSRKIKTRVNYPYGIKKAGKKKSRGVTTIVGCKDCGCTIMRGDDDR